MMCLEQQLVFIDDLSKQQINSVISFWIKRESQMEGGDSRFQKQALMAKSVIPQDSSDPPKCYKQAVIAKPDGEPLIFT